MWSKDFLLAEIGYVIIAKRILIVKRNLRIFCDFFGKPINNLKNAGYGNEIAEKCHPVCLGWLELCGTGAVVAGQKP